VNIKRDYEIGRSVHRSMCAHICVHVFDLRCQISITVPDRRTVAMDHP